MIFRKHSYKLILYIIIAIAYSSCKIPSRINKNVQEDFSSKHVLFIHKNEDQSNSFQQIINQFANITIEFEANKHYQISNILFHQKNKVNIIGNGSFIYVAPEKTTESIFTFIDPESLIIENITLSGNYPLAKTKNYLLRIHTPNDRTKKIIIDKVNLISADNGGLLIQNIDPSYKVHDWTGGADSVKITNCIAKNTGNKSPFQIRGSHQNVLIENCIGSDSLSRQRFGSIFNFSAEVGIQNDYVGKVVMKNCKAERHNRAGLFFQKVLDVSVDGFISKHGGVQPYYLRNSQGELYEKGVNSIKIDDLGDKGKAYLKNIKVIEPNAKLKYKIGLAIEESKNKSSSAKVVLDSFYFENVGIRLTASGHNVIRNGKIINGKIKVSSPKNLIANVDIINSNTVGIEINDINNSIQDCNLKNANIYLYNNFDSVQIINNHFFTDQNSILNIGGNGNPEQQHILVDNNSVSSNKSNFINIEMKSIYYLEIRTSEVKVLNRSRSRIEVIKEFKK